jgi:hypothetical protein
MPGLGDLRQGVRENGAWPNASSTRCWRLKAITSADIKGRVGPGGVEGLLVTLERILG